MITKPSEIRLGCSTWMMPAETFREKIKVAKEYGFDGVEIRLFENEAVPETVRDRLSTGDRVKSTERLPNLMDELWLGIIRKRFNIPAIDFPCRPGDRGRYQ